MADSKVNAIIVVVNGTETVLDLDNIISLSITLKKGNVALNYTERTESLIALTPIKQLEHKIDKDRKGPTNQPADRKSSKGFKHGPVKIKSIPTNTMVKIYKEYRTAVATMTGTIVVEHWSKKLNLNKSTLTVCMSQIKQVLTNKAKGYTPIKVRQIAEIINTEPNNKTVEE